jgi:antitoxin (DNA-binding transcriptional repressor) of toxin-antitoxin stability system
VRAEDEPSWAEVVRHAEHGESVAVVAHGNHVADVVPSWELERLRETIEVLSDTELARPAGGPGRRASWARFLCSADCRRPGRPS